MLFEVENLSCNFISSKLLTNQVNEEMFLTTIVDKGTHEIITNALVKIITNSNETIVQLIDINTNEIIHEEIAVAYSNYEQVVLGRNVICFKT